MLAHKCLHKSGQEAGVGDRDGVVEGRPDTAHRPVALQLDHAELLGLVDELLL